MKKKFLSRFFLVLSLLMINILVLNKYTDKGIVVAEGFDGWKEEGNEKYFFQSGKKFTGEYQNKYFVDGKLANWWCDDGKAWYFFQKGIKHNGYGIDANGRRYFVNGKYANGVYNGKLYKDGLVSKGQTYVNGIFYGSDGQPANGWYDDGNVWYFFKNGEKYTGKAVDGNGEMYFINGKYANAYIDGLFYKDGKLANWWCDDGKAWYFFQSGIKHNGFGTDANGRRYFIDGKYANGIYNGKLYKDGLVSKGQTYVNGIFYGSDGQPANAWYDDGNAWYFFVDGKKHTGKAVDGNGEMYFINGKYANAYIDGLFYKDGKLANWWCDDGKAWYFFQSGIKHNGFGTDANGRRYFVNGKYANGIYDGKLYKDGLVSKGQTYANGVFYDENISPANGWYDDGNAWYFFKNGEKHTGKAVDGNGEMYFINGKYANAYIDEIFYTEGKIANGWYDDGTDWYFF